MNRIGIKSGVGVVILTAAAASLSAYLAFSEPANLAGCSPDDPAGCATVLTSKWSVWLGLPVSLAGLATYSLALLGAISVLMAPTAFGWGLLFFTLTTAAGAAVWFTGLQLFNVEALCPYCLATHAFGLAAWLLVVADGLRHGNDLPSRIWFAGTLPAGIAIAALVGGQVYDRYELRVEVVDRWDSNDETFARATAFHEALQTPQAELSAELVQPFQTAVPPREITLLDGKLSMQIGEYPILGDPNAPHFIGVVSDYTCPACRRLHTYLKMAMEKYDHRFAVVVFPMAMDSKCNPHMSETTYGHRNACLLSKLSLALWSIDPKAYAQFSEQVYRPSIPPGRAEAVALADSLVGAEALDRAMSNPLFDRMLYFSINLLYSPLMEKPALPSILTPKGVHAGLPESEEALHTLLEEALGLSESGID